MFLKCQCFIYFMPLLAVVQIIQFYKYKEKRGNKKQHASMRGQHIEKLIMIYNYFSETKNMCLGETEQK